MNNTKYNGWTNYETWNVKLWQDNDQGSQEYYSELAGECWKQAKASESFTQDEQASLDLAVILKEESEENAPELTGYYADLMNAALSEINWHEIASHYIDEVEKD